MSYLDREIEAKAYYREGLERVATTPAPRNQKFPVGARVRIAKDLGPSMSHFYKDRLATIEYTYAHAYGGGNVESYSLNIDGIGSVAWYKESQLTLV